MTCLTRFGLYQPQIVDIYTIIRQINISRLEIQFDEGRLQWNLKRFKHIDWIKLFTTRTCSQSPS